MVPLQSLAPGAKVKLRGDIIAEVRENPQDGMWIVVRYLSGPDLTAPADDDEMVYADDVIALA